MDGAGQKPFGVMYFRPRETYVTYILSSVDVRF